MKTEYLFFILLSALLHSSYNFLMRKSKGNLSFLTWIFAVSSFISLIISLIFTDFSVIPWKNVIFIYIAAFFYVVYQVFVSKAYETGEITACYPLTLLSPVFVPIWAFIFLSEKISLLTMIGIIITIAGAITIKLNSFSLKEFKKIFSLHADYRSARYALAASLMYSIAATFDKSKISSFELPVYISLISLSMTLNLLIFTRYTKQLSFRYIKINRWPILTGGVMVYLSFIFFRMALKHVYVSIAIPVRLSSIIFALILGVLVLKEKVIPSRIIGAAIIILGIIIINMEIINS